MRFLDEQLDALGVPFGLRQHGCYLSFAHTNATPEKPVGFFSLDGSAWVPFGASPAINAQMRDPSVIHFRGKWWLTATDSANGASTTVCLYSSPDLATWTLVGHITTEAGATNSWAPQFFIDPNDDSLHILVAISHDNETSSALKEMHPTNDAMTTWSAPVALDSGGTWPGRAIDASCIKIGATYYLFYKDDAAGTICLATSTTSLTAGYTVVKTGDWAGWKAAVSSSSIEAPKVVEEDDGKYRLYFAKNSGYTGNGMYYTETTVADLQSGWGTPVLMSSFSGYNHPVPLRFMGMPDHERASDPHPQYAIGDIPAFGSAGDLAAESSGVAASAGTSPKVPRADHVHAMPALLSNPMTTDQDIIVGGASGVPTRVAKGNDGDILTVDPVTHLIAWKAGAAGFANPMTTAGDLIVGGTAGAAARIAKGSDSMVLTMDPTTHLPVWATPASGFADPTTTKGDIIAHGSSTTRLPVGGDGKSLVADSSVALGLSYGEGSGLWEALIASYSPVHWWKMGEASGDFADSGSGGLTLATVGSVTYHQTDPWGGTSCVQLNATGKPATANRGSTPIGSNPRTVIMLIKTVDTGNGGQKNIFSMGATTNNNYFMYQLATGTNTVGDILDCWSQQFAQVGPKGADSLWHMIAFGISGSGWNQQMWMDGNWKTRVPSAQINTSASAITINNDGIQILVADIAIFDSWLGPAKLDRLWNVLSRVL